MGKLKLGELFKVFKGCVQWWSSICLTPKPVFFTAALGWGMSVPRGGSKNALWMNLSPQNGAKELGSCPEDPKRGNGSYKGFLRTVMIWSILRTRMRTTQSVLKMDRYLQ